MWNTIRRKLGGERGQALLEFAFVCPILLVFLLTLVDFGIALDRREVIQHAVREGTRLGAVGGSTSDIVDVTVDQSGGSFAAGDVTVCYVDGPGGSPNFGHAGSSVSVTGNHVYEFGFGSELWNFFGVAGLLNIEMTPSAEARLETSVTGATEC